MSFQPGNLPAVGTGALLQITRNWLYLKSSWKIRGSFCVAVLHTKRPSFFYGSFVCKAAAPGFCFLYLFFSKWICHRRKEAKHMKHNNLKKPAAVLTALALAAALLDLGYDINTTDEAQIREAYELLADAKSKGVYQSFVMDEVFGKMEGSNAAIAMYYAGDYLTMLDNNPDLKFVVPKEGSNWFVDAMCVLKTAQHKEEAEEWINFIASTESNLANMDYIGYASPNLEALEGYPAYYEETYGEPLDEERYEIMAAPDEVLARCELYTNLPADTLTLYNDLWTELGI